MTDKKTQHKAFCLSSQNYWLNIDKPYGYSSAKVVAIVKRITKAKRVGHAGTLDPLATGVLPIAVNKATKTCDYIMKTNKKYYFEISWGEFRDTDDFEGKITKTSDKRPSTSSIINILPNFIGTIFQTPSKFSAIKVNGKKAYQLARDNKEFELKPRKININQINLVFNNKDKAGLIVNCSKGTYVRTICRELSQKLGACGYVSTLKRLEVGRFNIKNTISLDKLKNMLNFKRIDDSIFKLRDVLDFMAEIALNDDLAFKAKNGQTIQVEDNLPDINQDNLVKIINNDELIGLGKFLDNKLKPVNIFNN